MAQVNMSLRIDAELKDAFMAAAKSMDRNGSQLIRDWGLRANGTKTYVKSIICCLY